MKKMVSISLVFTILATTAFGNQDADKCERLKGNWEWNGSVNKWQCLNASIDVNNTAAETGALTPIDQVSLDSNASASAGLETESKSESIFSKANLPMKVFYVVAVPVISAGAVVYYAVIAPFALVRWAFESKK
ncbi:MAG: hypothetical protein Q8K81_00765 [Sulfuricurvum sp.]|nr:hypothetical protein [Sulfuricurvum sp.]